MRHFVFILFFALIAFVGKSQDDFTQRERFVGYLEAGGPSLIGSLNGEYIFLCKQNFYASGRLGVGTALVGVNTHQALALNVGRKLSAEGSVGGSAFAFANISLNGGGGGSAGYVGFGSLGVRYQPIHGLMGRLGVMAFGGSDEWDIVGWFYFGIGVVPKFN